MTKVTLNGVTYSKEVIQNLLKTDRRWIERTLSQLYSFQTDEEKNIDGTIELNGKGFNGVDSEILSSFSKQLEKGRHLSDKQLEICKKLLPKYWRQIFEVLVSVYELKQIQQEV